MKDKIKNLTNKLKSNKGVLIVESAIVFPVMFFVLLFIIFIGNLFYEQARIDDIVTRYAVAGAQCVADPFLYDMEATNAVPTDTKSLRLEPYRYILGSFTSGSISDVEEKISEDVKTEINKSGLIFFNNTNAKYVGTDNKAKGEDVAYFKNYIVYSTFVVQVNYEVRFPLRFMGEGDIPLLTMSARAEVPVNDTDEFVRNIDMAVDLIEDTSGGQTIKGIFEKIGTFINSFAEK